MKNFRNKYRKFTAYCGFLLLLLLLVLTLNAERTPPGQIIAGRAIVEWKWDFNTFLDSTGVTDTTILIVQEFRNIVIDVNSREHLVLPDEQAEFDIFVYNDGNVPLEWLEIRETADFDPLYDPLDTLFGSFPVAGVFFYNSSLTVPYVEPGTVFYDSVYAQSSRFDRISAYDSVVVDEWDYVTMDKIAEFDTIVTNSSLDYMLIVENIGYKESENVHIVDSLPSGFRITNFNEPEYFQLESYDQVQGIVSWIATSLDEEKPDTILYTGYYSPRMCDSLAINNATLTFRDIVIKASDSVWVDCRPSISCSLWVDKDSAGPYDTLNYKIFLESWSEFTVEGITVYSIIPEHTENPIGEYDDIYYEPGRTMLIWNVDEIEPGEQIMLDYSVEVMDDMTEGSYSLEDSLKVYYNRSGRNYLLCKKSVTTGLIMDFLFINKRCMSRDAYIGDILIYTLKVQNKSEISGLSQVILDDAIPYGFKYVEGSAEILRTGGKHEIDVDDTSYSSRLIFNLGDIPANTDHYIAYQLVVGAGASSSDGVNRAIVYGYDNNGRRIVSNEAAEKVDIRGSQFDNEEFIIGKVFRDDDGNGVQTDGEKGIKNVTLFTETGIRIVTGDNGKFSIPYIKPGKHVLRIDHESLPDRSKPIVTTTQNALDPYSQFVDVPVSGFARATFAIQSGISFAEKVPFHRAGINIGINAIPEGAEFIDSKNPDGEYVITTVYFDKGEYGLSENAMKDLETMLLTIRQYVGVTLEIRGFTDQTPVRKGAEFKDNSELSRLRSSTVMSFLQQKGLPEHMLRYVGFGEQQSRGLDIREDRKVEVVAIMENGMRPKPPAENINFITYFDIKANEPIAEMNTRYQFIGMDYERQSAHFSGVPMDDRNSRWTEVAWQFSSLPAGFDKQLSFQAQLYEDGYYEMAPRLLLTGDLRFVSGEIVDFKLSKPVMPIYNGARERLRLESDDFPADQFRGFLSASFAEPIEIGSKIAKDRGIIYRLKAAFPPADRVTIVEIVDKLDSNLMYIKNSAYRDGIPIEPIISEEGLIWQFEILPGQTILEFEYLTQVLDEYEIQETMELPLRFR